LENSRDLHIHSILAPIQRWGLLRSGEPRQDVLVAFGPAHAFPCCISCRIGVPPTCTDRKWNFC